MQVGKKVYVYGTILAASLLLLASQAIVRKSPRSRPARDAGPAMPVDDSEALAALESDASATVADARVERLENSLSTLAALLPADRTRELEAIGRAWNNAPVSSAAADGADAGQSQAPSDALRLQVPTLLQHELADAPLAQEMLEVDSRAALETWLAANPLSGIAVSGSRSLAAFGGQLYREGEDLPQGLGRIVRIEPRGVVLQSRAQQRRVPLVALKPQPAESAPAAAVANIGSVSPPAQSPAIAPAAAPAAASPQVPPAGGAKTTPATENNHANQFP